MANFVARTYQSIQAQIISQVNTLLPALTSTSKAAYWQVWSFIVAVSQSLMEQRFVILQNQVEALVSSNVAATVPWITQQVLYFQDGNTIELQSNLTFAYPTPSYPTPITSCAVVPLLNGVLAIKVAASGAPLTSAQQTELKAYLAAILPAGMATQVISASGDVISVTSNVYYNGQSNSVILANTIAAINNYCSLLPFNGLVRVSDIEKAILAVSGVVDVQLVSVVVTPSVGSPVILVNASQTLIRSYQTYSGYLINGDGSGADLTFITATS